MSSDTWILVGTGLVGSLGSFYLGYKLTNRNEKRKEREELEKIHYLINADYTMINRVIDEQKEVHKQWYERLINKDSAVYYASSIDTTKELLPSLAFGVANFSYWEAIMSSGTLIKLKADDLRVISASHKVISSIILQHEGIWRTFSADILEVLYGNAPYLIHPRSPAERVEVLKGKYKIHFGLVMEGYSIIKEHVDIVHANIDWIDLQAEPIMELKPPSKSQKLKSEPYVREDGVTVYPDGMEVDRKGTIIKTGNH